jgi:hypothetical protein
MIRKAALLQQDQLGLYHVSQRTTISDEELAEMTARMDMCSTVSTDTSLTGDVYEDDNGDLWVVG